MHQPQYLTCICSFGKQPDLFQSHTVYFQFVLGQTQPCLSLRGHPLFPAAAAAWVNLNYSLFSSHHSTEDFTKDISLKLQTGWMELPHSPHRKSQFGQQNFAVFHLHALSLFDGKLIPPSLWKLEKWQSIKKSETASAGHKKFKSGMSITDDGNSSSCC